MPRSKGAFSDLKINEARGKMMPEGLPRKEEEHGQEAGIAWGNFEKGETMLGVSGSIETTGQPPTKSETGARERNAGGQKRAEGNLGQGRSEGNLAQKRSEAKGKKGLVGNLGQRRSEERGTGEARPGGRKGQRNFGQRRSEARG